MSPARGQRHTGRARLPSWVACVAAGLLLITVGVVLALERDDVAPRSRHAIAPVDVGTVPGSSAPEPGRTRGRQHVVRHGVPAGSRLRLTRLGVSASITRVRVVDNVMQVPLDPAEVGWWTSGAAPGDARGSTVIVGHVNYAGTSGALAAVPSLRPGDAVTVAEPTRSIRYRVAAVRTYAKSSGIPPGVFATGGAARLALITCGGPFDDASGNYADNIVAYAVPVP